MSGDEARTSDSGDNGVYVVEGHEIVDRLFFDWEEQDNHKLEDLLESIDKAQPEKNQLGEEFLKGVDVEAEDLEAGDEVFYKDIDGVFKKYEVLGKNDRGAFIGRYSNELDVEPYDWNSNNYLKGTVRKIQ